MSDCKISVRIEGLDELRKKMAEMTGKENKAIFRGGVRDGCNVVKKYAEAARSTKGFEVSVDAWDDHAEGKVRPRKNKTDKKSDFFFYKFIENGTKEHGPKKKSRKFMKFSRTPIGVIARKVRGVAARPFLRPALDNHLEEIQRAVMAGYKARLDKIVAKKSG